MDRGPYFIKLCEWLWRLDSNGCQRLFAHTLPKSSPKQRTQPSNSTNLSISSSLLYSPIFRPPTPNPKSPLSQKTKSNHQPYPNPITTTPLHISTPPPKCPQYNQQLSKSVAVMPNVQTVKRPLAHLSNVHNAALRVIVPRLASRPTAPFTN